MAAAGRVTLQLGRYTFGALLSGQHPALVDEEQFARVQQIIADNTKAKGPARRRATYVYLLTGVRAADELSA